MFGKIASFELRYQLKSPVLWITFLIFFLLTFLAVTNDNVQIGFAVRAGLGLAQRFHATAEHEVATGETVEVLVPFEPPRRQFHLYYPSRGQPPKLQAFIDWFCR